MKKIFTFLLGLSLMTSVFAQLPKDAKTQKITWSEVVTAQGLTAANVYKKAYAWGLKEKFTVKEKVLGQKIVFEANIPVSYNSVQRGGTEHGKVKFLITVFCKEGRYKYKMTSFKHTARHADCGALESETSECTKYQLKPGEWKKIKDQTKAGVEKIISRLVGSVKKAAPAATQDDDNDW